MQSVKPSGNENLPLGMAEYFDEDADDYDRFTIESGQTPFYECIEKCVPRTDDVIHLLSPGVGTGFELPYVWNRAPSAHVLGIDQSSRMIERCREKYKEKAGQLQLKRSDIRDLNLGSARFDCVLASATMHHFTDKVRRQVYAKFAASLIPGGIYIEADKFVSEPRRDELLARYLRSIAHLGMDPDRASVHIDIPTTSTRVGELLDDFDLDVWTHYEADGVAIICGRRR